MGCRLPGRTLRSRWVQAPKSVQGIGNDGVLDQDLERDDGQGGFVGGFKEDRAGSSGSLYLEPSCGADTPAIAGPESGKAELRPGGAEIVALLTGDTEKVFTDNTADGVDTEVVWPCFAAACAVETGHRLAAADLKRLS